MNVRENMISTNDQKKAMGAIIKSLRSDRHISQFELARSLDVTRAAVSQWESGKTMPSARSLRSLAKYFDVPINTLTVKSTEMYPGAVAFLNSFANALEQLTHPVTGGESNDSRNDDDKQ